MAVSNYWMFQITGIYVKVGGSYYHGCGYHYPDPSSYIQQDMGWVGVLKRFSSGVFGLWLISKPS